MENIMKATNISQMKAARIHQYGGPIEIKLETIAIPEPEEGEVLVKIFAAGVNPLDWKICEGYLAELIPHTLPLTLGWDFSGEIVSLGKNVNKWAISDAVYARPEFSKNGTYAEYIVVSEDEIASKPKTLSWQESAAVGIAAIQLAKQAGATVYTTSSSKNMAFLKELGADEVIDYTQEDFSKLLSLRSPGGH